MTHGSFVALRSGGGNCNSGRWDHAGRCFANAGASTRKLAFERGPRALLCLMMNVVIVCQTERLVLRHFTEEDLEPLAVIHADPDVMRFFGGARTVDQTRARLFDFLSAYQRVGFSKWAVVLRATGELIGRCGPAIEPIEGVEEVELGYDLAKRYWGQGLATEAATASLAHCSSVLGLRRVISIIDPRNIASQHVALRLGMRHEREILWRDRRFRLYARSFPSISDSIDRPSKLGS